MILTELTSVPDSALPLQAFKNQLRLGTGFGEDTLQDAVLNGVLRAAMTVIEGRVGKALVARSFNLRIEDWQSLDEQTLPVAPVSSVASVTLVDSAGVNTALGTTSYRLVPDTHRPKLDAVGVLFPAVPGDGHVDIVFTAGFGVDWTFVPTDLSQAVLILAAVYYEDRHDNGMQSPALPHAVLALIERWRTVRLLGGKA
jgi:uncharacterized phiE125 gp8 family phage protein